MNNTTSLQDTLQDKKKLNELEQWLNEDKSICKADRDYILDFITKNYISKQQILNLECLKEEKIQRYDDRDIEYYKDGKNQKIKEIKEAINNLK